MGNKVYLAGGMEKAEDGLLWRNQATSALFKHDIICWNPYKEESNMLELGCSPFEVISSLDKVNDFYALKSIMRKIVKYDLNIIKNEVSSLMVKYDLSVLNGAGTHAEMSLATLLNIPVNVWLEGLTFRDIPSWAIGCIDTITESFDDAIINVVKSVKR